MPSKTLSKIGLSTAVKYIAGNPEKNMIKIMDIFDKFAGEGADSYPTQRAVIRRAVEDKDNNMHNLILNVFNDIDQKVLESTLINFLVNANMIGWKKEQEYREKYQCNIPWAILMDPTSACNLHCTGCWAAEYGNKLNLTFDELNSIICQGKEMGVHMYIYTGGEPLVRKNDVIKLCEKHSDCQFLSFTNGTLIDDEFTDEMLRVRNFIPAISVEGFKDATDVRRGGGTYDKVIAAMDLLKKKRLPFGISCCYTSQNMDSISSMEFIDAMIERGAKFAWYFHYMPVGNNASPELLPRPEQREHMYHWSREVRATRPIFLMDFQDDGEYTNGCIAGGRRYLHINANGDVDPCVFIHYSDSNIREKSLLDCLRSPLFMAYHDGQPFNDNMLRPCPMLENPEKLREMIRKTEAGSTDLESPEDVEHLCAKCDSYAENWIDSAGKLWEISKAKRVNKNDEKSV